MRKKKVDREVAREASSAQATSAGQGRADDTDADLDRATNDGSNALQIHENIIKSPSKLELDGGQELSTT